MSILEVHDVSIRYITGDFKDIGLKEFVIRRLKRDYHVNEFWADRHISFTLEKGDMLGIIGTNGAGKSTLLKAVSGIMEPTEGYVKRNGNIAALLELTSGFDGELTVRENAYLRGAMLGYTRKFMDDMYHKIIEFAELREFQDRPFKQLSSGMKSRLAFSIACLVEPNILILDEVLSVGDGAFRKKSGDRMKALLAGGVTGILVSHSVGQIRELCTKALWLEEGRQIAFGQAQEICDAYEDYLATPKARRHTPKNQAELERISKDFRLYKKLEQKEQQKNPGKRENAAEAEQRWMKEIRSWDKEKRERLYEAYAIEPYELPLPRPPVENQEPAAPLSSEDRAPHPEKKKIKAKIVLWVCALILAVLVFFPLSNYLNTAREREQRQEIAAVTGRNAESPLALQSAYGDIEATHPKVISFMEPWNGYRYWISFSPYPKADDAKENPHLLASNDMEHWEKPPGFQNPLEDTPENYEKAVVYNSDPELFYNEETDELECWWRFVDDSEGKRVSLYRRRSGDGVHWTEKEKMLSGDRAKRDYLSPALLYEEGRYKMWSIGSQYRVQYMESTDGKKWSEPRFLEVEYASPSLKNWHISVIHTKKGYEMTLASFDSSLPSGIYPRGVMNLYYTKSGDNVTYEKARVLLAPGRGREDWDNKGLYRSALLCDTDGEYYLFYSGIARDETRGVGKIGANGFCP